MNEINEDGMSVIGGTPTNSVGTGEIAGIGIGKDGEPGVDKKKKKEKSPIISFSKFLSRGK
jgi:hypothetical protein